MYLSKYQTFGNVKHEEPGRKQKSTLSNIGNHKACISFQRRGIRDTHYYLSRQPGISHLLNHFIVAWDWEEAIQR